MDYKRKGKKNSKKKTQQKTPKKLTKKNPKTLTQNKKCKSVTYYFEHSFNILTVK